MFSWHAIARILEMTAEEKDIAKTLDLIGKMVVALDASYNYSTVLAHF
jgi:hypothetical protein